VAFGKERMGIANRAGMISAYFAKDRNFPITLREVVRNGLLQRTCKQIGPEYVLGIRDCGALEMVFLREISAPLYWPKEIPHRELYKSCTDCLYPAQWHHYEVPETSVEGGENVADCGAAEGIFSLSVAGRAGKIALFEPWEGFQASLKATFDGRCEIRSQALGEKTHTAYLSGSLLYGQVSETEGTSISVTTLDQFRREFGPIDYIKADVEGSEHDLLAGAKETIFADKPKIAITTYHLGNDWERMVSLVRDVVPGYRFRTKGVAYCAGRARPVMLHMWN
jgi:FkbM family methyltransferase